MPIEPPVFSIVIPTYNRLPLLKQTLESVFRQDFSPYEVIVVSDGSTDGTHEFLSSFAGEGKLSFFIQQNQGPARARNLGIHNAKGTYIVFTDDDCVVPPHWLASFDERFHDTGALGIGGSSRPGNPANLFALTSELMVNFFKTALNKRDARTPFLTSNNTAYRKTSLETVGGFHHDFKMGAEERDLNFRLTQRGETLIYDASICIEHHNDTNFAGFLKHQFLYGRGSSLLYSTSKKGTGPRPAMIPPGVYVKLFFHPFKEHPFGKAVMLSLLIVLAQSAIVIGYVRQALSGNGK